jgi:L-cysteine/cystine lyase
LFDRADLPAVAGRAYLNAGTFGPLPRAAAEAMTAETVRAVEAPRLGAPAYEHMNEIRTRARAAAARALGARVEDVAVTSSTSQGVGLVCAGLAWREGDEVVTTTDEHQGILGPLDELRRRGVEVRQVAAADVAAAVGPRTRMVAVSHVLWTDGRVVDLPAAAEAVRAAGGILLVDGAQSAGNVPVDVEETGADFYAASGQKWLLGPGGSGALWVHPRHHETLRPATPSYFTYADGVVGTLKEGAARFDSGSIDIGTLAGFAAAVEWVEGLPGGRDAWLALAAERVAAARAALAGAGLDVVDVPGPATGLVAIRRPTADLAAEVEALADRGVLIRSLPGRPLLRASVGAWTTDADIDALVAGLTA